MATLEYPNCLSYSPALYHGPNITQCVSDLYHQVPLEYPHQVLHSSKLYWVWRHVDVLFAGLFRRPANVTTIQTSQLLLSSCSMRKLYWVSIKSLPKIKALRFVAYFIITLLQFAFHSGIERFSEIFSYSLNSEYCVHTIFAVINMKVSLLSTCWNGLSKLRGIYLVLRYFSDPK